MKHEIINQFKNYFAHLNLSDLSALDDIYSDEITFTDPIHQVNGIDSLKQYFATLNKNLVHGSFHFTDETVTDNETYLQWEVSLTLKKPDKTITATGISVLTIDEKIIRHRDYFDAGELFYEHIPVLGAFIRIFKKKIRAATT
ncbi:MAG: nuclear transport factor 2 family protein [Balneolaceae bacterium]|nr:nuclear transport factor 2 family protein [Balneolaceae bacterium]